MIIKLKFFNEKNFTKKIISLAKTKLKFECVIPYIDRKITNKWSNTTGRAHGNGALFGFEYAWNSIKGFIRINYIDIQESKRHDLWLTEWTEMNDSLKTSDIIVGALYRIYSVVALKSFSLNSCIYKV